MAIRFAIQNGDWNNTSTWDGGATLGIPTSADDVYSNNFTVNMVSNATVISLNNSTTPRIVADIATPAMTSNNTPSGVAFAATTLAGTAAWYAFDQVVTSTNSWASNDLNTGILGYQFTSGKIIKRYAVRSLGAFGNTPRDWTFQGSNDGVSYTTLDTVTSATFLSGVYVGTLLANTTSYTYYRINITAVQTAGNRPVVHELEITENSGSGIGNAAGGSFNFNTAGVTVSATSTSAALSAGATNLITVTATTGTVTLSLGSAVTGFGVANTQIFNYTGNCNFTLNGVRFTGGGGSTTNAFCINKSSTGTITITGDLVGGSGVTTPHALSSSAGNTVVIGSVFSGASGLGISQSAGNVTVTGNVTGGTGTSVHGISLTGAASQFTINGDVRGGSGSAAYGINFGGTLGTVNGNVTGGGGSNGHGIFSSTSGINVTGDVRGFIGYGIQISGSCNIIGNVFGGSIFAGIGNFTNSSLTVTVTGDVYASTTQAGIQLTGTGTQVVNLTGNMYNTLGRSVIWCPNVFISNTATTLWRMDTGGGNYKFLYSADSTPNLPATTNVRNGVTFGPALSLTGTMVVPSASDVRENVPVDNTVGTGELTSADIISGINASSDDLAVRLKNTLTDTTAGNIISQYNNS